MAQTISFLFARTAKIDIKALTVLRENSEKVLCKCVYFEEKGKHKLDYNIHLSENLELQRHEFILEEFVTDLLHLFDVMEKHKWNFANLEVRLQHILKTAEGYQYIYLPIIKKKTTSAKKVTLNLLKQLKSEDARIASIISTLKHLATDKEVVSFLKNFEKQPMIREEETAILNQPQLQSDEVEVLMQDVDTEGETSILSEHTTVFLQNESAECETTFLTGNVSIDNAQRQHIQRDCEMYLLRVSTGECIHINKNSYSIGKDLNNMDYVLGNQSVSRNHATICCEGDNFYLTDNGSTNGTTIEGIRVKTGEKAELGDGDIISLGNEVFQVLLERK